MSDRFEIKGGANEFEAAVVAVVVDRIASEEAAARVRGPGKKAGLPAWIRAGRPEDVRIPREQVWPD